MEDEWLGWPPSELHNPAGILWTGEKKKEIRRLLNTIIYTSKLNASCSTYEGIVSAIN